MATSGFWLDSYNDIYSDFDSRHYKSRRISEDLLHELRTDMRYNQQSLEELHLFLPGKKRNEATEAIIADSMKSFFLMQYHRYQIKCRRKLYVSTIMGFSGITIMLLDAVLIFLNIRTLATTLLSTVMEPASWFLLWTAVDYLIYDWKELKKDRNFYRKLSEANVIFQTS